MFIWGLSAIFCSAFGTLLWIGAFLSVGLVGANVLAWAFSR
jgi:hypothetical protein